MEPSRTFAVEHPETTSSDRRNTEVLVFIGLYPYERPLCSTHKEDASYAVS
jgi:hypothetical protein